MQRFHNCPSIYLSICLVEHAYFFSAATNSIRGFKQQSAEIDRKAIYLRLCKLASGLTLISHPNLHHIEELNLQRQGLCLFWSLSMHQCVQTCLCLLFSAVEFELRREIRRLQEYRKAGIKSFCSESDLTFSLLCSAKLEGFHRKCLRIPVLSFS